MIDLDQIAAALIAVKPQGAHRMEVAYVESPLGHYGPYWNVTIYKGDTCALENGATLESAIAKATVNFLRKTAERDRAANMAHAYFGDCFAEAAK